MAVLYPEISHALSESIAERQLIEAFATQLGKEWTLIHSFSWVDAGGTRLRLGECDFVALHPAYGWLSIEAKTGSLAPDYATGKWRCSNGTLIQDPIKQAQRGMFRIRDELARHIPSFRDNPPPYGYAVAFPHTRKLPEQMPPHAARELFILEGDMSRLEKRLVEIISFQTSCRISGQAFSAEEHAALLKVLLPSFRIVPSLSRQLEREGEVMLRLSEQQSFFLQSCRDAHRLLVTGPSGSGKTLLALEEAKRFAGEGADVLLMCFNRSLADHLTKQVESFSGITVNSFHGFARQVIEGAGLPYAVPSGRAEQSHFFEHDVPEMFLSALPACERRFDVVLVDEAQDFRDTWWVCVYELLRDGESSRLHLFGDDKQNLFQRGDSFPFADPVITLPLNCRNTQCIARWIEKETGLAAPTNSWCPEGVPPVVAEIGSDREEQDGIRKVLHQLIHEEGISADRVVILGARAFSHSIFTDGLDLGPCRVRNFPRAYAVDTGEKNAKPFVRYATIHGFKGLEADAVILTGIGLPNRHGEDPMTLLYVGASRARHRLFVFKRIDSRA